MHAEWPYQYMGVPIIGVVSIALVMSANAPGIAPAFSAAFDVPRMGCPPK